VGGGDWSYAGNTSIGFYLWKTNEDIEKVEKWQKLFIKMQPFNTFHIVTSDPDILQ